MLFRALLICAALLVSALSFVIIQRSGGTFGIAMALINILVVVACILLERSRYKPLLDRTPGGDWIDTGERSIDPATGRLVSVYYHPATGERQYVGGPRAKFPH